MIKKIVFVLFISLLCLFSASASDWHFIFDTVTQHPEIVWGFLPSYVNLGVGYKGLSILEGDTTDLQLLVGGGYNQRKLWQDPKTGEVLDPKVDPLIYDVIDIDWSLRFAQGFLSNPMNQEEDLITFTLAYNGQFEKSRDSMVVGKEKFNGEKRPILSIDQFFSNHQADRIINNIYPEINGNGEFLGTQFAAYLKINAMEDSIQENNGFLGKLSFLWGPKALNNALDGYADYVAFRADAIGAYTLYDYISGGKSWFSIVLIDRANFGYVSGDALPAFIQGPESLGRKVRGFNTYTYNTKYTVVNNLDIRLAGPDMGVKGLVPRVNLFFDMVMVGENLIIRPMLESNFLASTGFQGTISFFDFIDLGYQVAYLIKGDNYAKGSKLVGSFTFFLDF